MRKEKLDYKGYFRSGYGEQTLRAVSTWRRECDSLYHDDDDDDWMNKVRTNDLSLVFLTESETSKSPTEPK